MYLGKKLYNFMKLYAEDKIITYELFQNFGKIS